MNRQTLAIVGLLGVGAATAWAAAGERGRAGRFGPERVKEELGLSEAQASQLRKLWMDGRKARIRRHADVAIARLELDELLEAPQVDERAVSAKTKDLADLEAGALRSRVEARLAVRKALTPEQHDKLKSLMRERRGPRPHHRRAGWGGDGSGDGGDGQDVRSEESLTGSEAR